MKKFNFSKGLVIGLLTLALCLTCFAAAKVSADEEKPQITFTAYVNGAESSYKVSYDNNYVAPAAAVTAGWYKSDGIVANLKIKDGSNYITTADTTLTIVYTPASGNDPEAQDYVAEKWEVQDHPTYTIEGYTTGEDITVTYKAEAAEVLEVKPTITMAKVLEDLGKLADTTYILDGTFTLANGDSEFYGYSDGTFTIKKGTAIKINVNVKVPEVTFTVMLDEEAFGEAPFYYEDGYTFTPEDFLAKGTAVTLDDILNGASYKDESDKDVKFISETNTVADWIINTNTGASPTYGLLSGDAEKVLKYDKTSKTYSLKADLKADKAVTIWLAPATIRVRFEPKSGATYPYNQHFESEIEVPNGAKTKISFMDISAGFKKLKENSTDEYDVLENYLIVGATDGIFKAGTTSSTTDYTKAYASLAYEVDYTTTLLIKDPDPVTGLELAPAFDQEGYDSETDSLVFVSPVNLTIYWTDCKKSAGVQLKGSQLKTLAMTKVTEKNGDVYFKASIPLYDKTAGVKIAESKDAYIYASYKAPAADKTKYTGNYFVGATPYKKIAVTFAYAQADKDNTDPAIATITTIDTKKKTVIYSGYYDADTNTDHYLYKKVTENGEEIVQKSDIFWDLQYSTDGTTWYGIFNNPVDAKTGKQVLDLNLNKLYEYVESGAKTTLYFRVQGAAEEFDDPDTADKDESAKAYRSTKAVKVNVAGAKDAKAVKVNVATGALALKNGYDFVVCTDAKATPAAKDAKTILPFNKEGKATTKNNEGEDVNTSVINTKDFVPVKKVTENKQMFTNIKVKSYLISDMVQDVTASDMYIWIRKSATSAKPAEKWVCVTISKVTAAPTIATAKGATYYIAQDPADTKGVIGTPEVKNASTDKNSGTYEYLIVDAKDITDGKAVIDMTTAKWATLTDKGLTVGKSKSKYAVKTGDKASDHVLKDGSAILVRRAGDKSSGLLASEYLVTMIVKEDVTYKDADNKDQTKALYVWKAFSAN